MYGYPFLSESRKPTRAQAERLHRLFHDARFAFNEKQHTWEILQPVSLPDKSTGGRTTRWSRVMRLGKEITEQDFLHLRRVRKIHEGAEKVADKDAAEEAANRDEARHEGDKIEEAGRKMYRILPAAFGFETSGRASFSGRGRIAMKRRPAASTAGFKRSAGGLLVPNAAGG